MSTGTSPRSWMSSRPSSTGICGQAGTFSPGRRGTPPSRPPRPDREGEHHPRTPADPGRDRRRPGDPRREDSQTQGWTAQELARRAHVSYSLLAKVESGAPRRARRSSAPWPRRCGWTYRPSPASRTPSRGARPPGCTRPSSRSGAAWIPMICPTRASPPRPAAELAADVRRISALGQAVRYWQIGAELPGLLDELGTAVHTAPAADGRRLFGLLAEAYSGASAIAGLVGYLDLRGPVVDRIRWRRASPETRCGCSGSAGSAPRPDGRRCLRPGPDADGPGPGRPGRRYLGHERADAVGVRVNSPAVGDPVRSSGENERPWIRAAGLGACGRRPAGRCTLGSGPQ
jgi:hypothetical protein